MLSEAISSSPYQHQLEKENEDKKKPKSEPKTKKTCLGCSEVYK